MRTLALALVLLLLGPAPAEANTLRWRQAQKLVRARAAELPVPEAGALGDRVELDWCNRWTRHRVDCGATRTVTYFDEETDLELERSCSATFSVRLSHRTGRTRVRQTNLSCGY